MSVRRSLAWVTFGQGSFVILQFIGSVVVARLLSPHDTGVFAIALAIVGVLSVIQALGLTNFLIREAELTPDLVGTALTVNGVMTILLAALIATLGFVGGAWFNEPGVRDVLLVLAVVPIIGQLAFVPNAMLEREGAFKTLALLKTASTMIGLVITVTLAWLGYRYMSLAYSQVATAALTNLTVLAVARRHISFRLSLAHWSRVSRFGFQIFAISGLTRIAQRTSDIILGRLLGLASLGLYARAANNYNLLWDNVHGAFTRVVLVDFAAVRRSGGTLRERYLGVSELLTGLLWPVLAGVAVLAGPIVQIVYGTPWVGAAAPLSLLCVAGMLLASITMTWEVFVVCDETGTQARFEFWRTIFSVSLFTAGCFHSIEAAAAARIGDALFAQFLYRPHLERLTGAKRREFGAIYLRSGAAALGAVAPALALMLAWRWSTDVPFLQVLAAIVAGMILWLLLIRLLGHPIYREIRMIAGKLRGRVAAA